MVAQLVERSLPTLEVRGSNPISNVNDHYSTNRNLEMMKLKEKEAGNDPCS